MKKTWKRLTSVVALILVAAMVAACGGGNGGGTAAGGDGPAIIAQGVTEDEISIGMVFPVSGWAAFFGVPIRDVIEAVINRANAHGGIDGKQINFMFHDDGGDPFQGHVLIETLVEEERVFALTGLSGAHAAMSLEYLLDFGIPIVNMTGGAGFLYSEHNPGGTLFNVQPSNNIDSPLLLARILATPLFGENGDEYFTDGAPIGFVTAPTEAGFELAAVLEEVARDIGVHDQLIIEFATADIYHTVVHQMMGAGVEAVIYAGMGGMAFVSAMYDAGWYAHVFGTYGLSVYTAWSPDTYSPGRRIFANAWAENESPRAIAMLDDMRDALNYLDRISDAERDAYIHNGFAQVGYWVGTVLVTALQRFPELGLDWSWENFIVAMEHAPFDMGGAPEFSFANGRRMGVEQLALWEFRVTDAGEIDFGLVSDFDTLEEILAPWRIRTGR